MQLITLEQWRAENARWFLKHNRAGKLMRRPGIKERVKTKWMNAYRHYLDRIPSPEAVCDIYGPGAGSRLPFSGVPNAHALAEERSDDSQQRVVGGKDQP